MERLAAQWRGVVAGISGAHTAHGDLQHGNVLIDGGGQIRLVDYDGFYIPALRGRPPGENGHANYQHPQRIASGHYEENADAFSALLIYVSLLAVRADATLWKFNNGDNLIFVENDLRNPGKTALWTQLRANSDAQVKRLTGELERFCSGPVAAVPDLEACLHSLPPTSTMASSASPSLPVPTTYQSTTPPGRTVTQPQQALAEARQGWSNKVIWGLVGGLATLTVASVTALAVTLTSPTQVAPVPAKPAQAETKVAPPAPPVQVAAAPKPTEAPKPAEAPPTPVPPTSVPSIKSIIGRSIPVNLESRYHADWILTLSTIDVQDDKSLKLNINFRNNATSRLGLYQPLLAES